jgi:hypothetical protein
MPIVQMMGRSIVEALFRKRQRYFHHDYSWISYLLKQAGAQPVSVFYDPDKVFEEYLDQAFERQVDTFEITDASDFVAFYPTLSGEILFAALRCVFHHELCNQVTSAKQVLRGADI